MNTKLIKQIKLSPKGKTRERLGNLPQVKGIEQLAPLIHDRMGLHFNENKKRELILGITSSAKNLGYSSTESFINFLLNNKWKQDILDSLASELTIGETYFLRNRKLFDMIVNCVIPEKSKNRKLKFWSAACSTGEEPYSIAVVLDRTIPDINKWDIEIIASDINKNALQKAESGVYRPWSFRESEFPDKEHYFTENDSGSFALHMNIKKMVKFFWLNLMSEAYPSVINGTTDCDIIFCRNVLIYFSFNTAAKVIERLYNCLKPGGLLILSATELALVPDNLFELIELSGNLILKKPLSLNGTSNLLQFNFKPPDNLEIHTKSILDKDDNEYKGLKPQRVKVKIEKEEVTKNVLKKQEKTNSLKKTRCVLSSDKKYKEAERLADKGNYEEAIQMCKQAIEEEPLQSKWNYLYSVVLFESDSLNDAAKAISRVLYLDADNVMGHIMSGHINNALGKKKLAIKNFNNAVELLSKFNNDDVINGSGGITAERLKATIEAVYGEI